MKRMLERWLLSLLVWAPADVLISLIHDFWPHVLIDAVAVASIAIPVLLLRSMHGREAAAVPSQG